ncbi:acyltransferase [Methylocystis sp. WRRC1]|uniref:acyltransferase family protein n=1 Tax=unclassified Methylocystis TaxID=2625913 RepID=UPI0001F8782F|nr:MULTISPECIES: acyltransferase [unclassified Methylocystis]MCC3244774.1 acyltransferase [Methylocystis sp. WRRC1]
MSVGSDKLASPGALRMALAFAVFLHHTSSFNLGMSAVLIFFVLSGYWVATMWTRTYSKTTAAYFTYLVSRVWRVAPVFALCSAITWALLFWRGGAPEDVGGLLHQFFSNIMILGYNSLPYQANLPGWSLDMEMQFYLIAPLVVFLVSKNIFLLFACVLVSFFSPWLGGAATVAPFLYFFGIGVASASHDLNPSSRLAYGSLFGTLALLLVCSVILVKNIVLGGSNGEALLAFGPKTNMLIALMMTPWALYTTRQKSGATDRMFGELSYIFYLLHWSVIGALGTGAGSYANRLLLCSEALAVILAASFVIWLLFDRPINRLRAAWVASRRIVAEPAGALQPLVA